MKTPYSLIPKTPRKKLHRGTKANCRCRICQKVMTTKMKITTKSAARKKTVTSAAVARTTAMATAEVTGMPAPEEDPQNG